MFRDPPTYTHGPIHKTDQCQLGQVGGWAFDDFSHPDIESSLLHIIKVILVIQLN